MTYQAKYQLALDDAIVVDNFAGGGGASTGMEMALGRPVNLGINHDPQALQMHEANHPLTRHLCEDVYNVDPVKECGGRKISDIWFSPDCKHFSKAKGGKPVEKRIRGLAWVVMKWADMPRHLRPDRIYLENVEEFMTWCRLKGDMPDKEKMGENFRSFVNALRNLGYVIEWRVLCAADYGVPTIRKRLFLIARCDGLPIVWPQQTHAKKPVKGSGLKPWRTAAECIDWNVPAPSIFAPDRKLLATNTLNRVAKGFKKFVLDNPTPYLVTINHGGDGFRGQGIDESLDTLTQKNGFSLVQPYLTEHANGSSQRVFAADEPLRTQCAQVKGVHFALVSPYLAGVGGRAGQSRPRGIDEPTGTITAKADTAIVQPYLVGAGGPARAGEPKDAFKPIGTMTTRNHTNIVAPSLIEIGYGENKGQSVRAPGLDKPLGTVVSGGRKHAVTALYLQSHFGNSSSRPADAPLSSVMGKEKISLTAAWMVKHFGGVTGVPINTPAPTITSRPNQNQLATAYITKLKGTSKDGQPIEDPLHTVNAGGLHHALTAAYLVKYYGAEQNGQTLDTPLHTVTAKDRYGFVQAEGALPPLDDDTRYNAWVTLRFLEQFGAIEMPRQIIPGPRPQYLVLGNYIVVDIGMRMLTPRELYTAQGFPKEYIIDRDSRGKPITKTAQVRMCGNSVPPPMSCAIVKANAPPTVLFGQKPVIRKESFKWKSRSQRRRMAFQFAESKVTHEIRNR